MSIKFEKVSYTYFPGSPLEKKGLDNVSFKIKEGQFIAIIGHTGSGKSTLMQHFNALLKPSKGRIEIAGQTILPTTSNKNLKELRKHVSLVFQFPEAQLFENTVLDDIAFGPKNFGYSEQKAKEKAWTWLTRVGLPKSVANRSPFDLSGGQMRQVAIAGVMAYEPDILCLDEPAAGLDPRARKQMMGLFSKYQQEGHTVILVTHNMDDVANYANDVLVMESGKLIKHARPAEVFKDRSWLKEHYIEEPKASLFASKLTNFTFSNTPLTIKELVKGIENNLKE
ncbi:energy-coupling factor transporter ATPase [Lactobacillus acetotolerans]|uniref:Energy-coupling factor transporter ATP-binding protein EcfA2 n=1 Tax=Lactobacillus acetotolerans TaxID=1600 RepID=A0A5P5ZIK2_9LACO|nr:energy-coupling factor transporter ATPase [Lactobacillus acetotolerans]KRN42171.1 ABC superfamily ATP binding cassette transporter, ABC protein [Lactobacillus acetotolerans DSM 20749 = JCM 3825]QFG50882.1 energy-coupling factor transporter ATPase [Lactobacillus acetotolerans]QJD72519.1 energy-coupling factor transporter ATPase [Lactobacillus acetotolerans]GGV07327.1 energy-coupling factor transporter ATP-binding protein EcfA2 [Lactobacillus acetotolerans DSM 20749 = JCM 3825]